MDWKNLPIGSKVEVRWSEPIQEMKIKDGRECEILVAKKVSREWKAFPWDIQLKRFYQLGWLEVKLDPDAAPKSVGYTPPAKTETKKKDK